jgi:hypothetical protein
MKALMDNPDYTMIHVYHENIHHEDFLMMNQTQIVLKKALLMILHQKSLFAVTFAILQDFFSPHTSMKSSFSQDNDGM